ncbi:unnamed protein product [Didymodactylos carnosus]|uniref:Ubiquitin-like domain-containing protein n=1 Tax=Didymodactylos carnosus TaxID=1234261 RepID=A0A815HIZ2_9BILA|nr:unnamed protein product [Didymodactylos carnosus]CAF0781354.1 unnamed protein product [Didymodactylos carnosus]CAF1354640.1 unnamed protein product [Didymodactylos carnosus]CAF3563007.1 unnamed protein product [Didymodactylos carnosus]CAF3563025.1 unnamed protein product [Didymodactylos carnosus]
MQIFVKILDTYLITLDVDPLDTLSILKSKIEKKEGIIEDQQYFVHGGMRLKDEHSLAEQGVTQDSTVYLHVGGLRGGRAMGIEFVDVSNTSGLKRVKWNSNVPKWRISTHGLCLEGICYNLACEAYLKQVQIKIGMTKFDLVTDSNSLTTKCPMCYKYVEPITCSFSNCYWRWSGIKQDSITDEPHKCSGDWKYADNAYHYFDQNISGAVIWRRLLIETQFSLPDKFKGTSPFFPIVL